MKKLPEKLFVTLRNKGTDDEYLYATTDLRSFDDGEIFGRYEQVSLEKLVLIHRATVVKKKRKPQA